MNDDVAQVIEPTFQLLPSYRGPRQLVGRHDVVGEEAVDVGERRLFIQVGGEQLRMSRLRAAVAAGQNQRRGPATRNVAAASIPLPCREGFSAFTAA